MIFKSLDLDNFKQYQKLNLEFKEGLVGIAGKNGSGKSTIFEGILLCLFGSISSDKDFYRTSWAGEKEAVKLVLQFEVGAKNYKVVREFRGKALTHQAAFYDQKDVQIASGANPVNEAVSQTIGLDKDAFTRSIFSGQKELGILSNTKGEERKRMIRKMIGLDNLDHIQKLIREDRNSIKKQIQGQEALLLDKEALKEFEQNIKSSQKEIRSSEQQLEKDRKAALKKQEQYLNAKSNFDQQLLLYQQHQQLQKELKGFESLLDGLNEQLTEKKAAIQDLKQKEKEQASKTPLVKKHLEQKAQKEVLDQEKIKFDQQQKLKEKAKTYQERIDELKANIEKIQQELTATQTLEKQSQALQAKLQKHKETIATKEVELQAVNSAIGAIEGKVDERKQQIQTIQQLGKDAECPTCLQPLINSYDQTIEHLQKAIEEYEKAALKENKKIFAQLQTALTAEKEALEKETKSFQNTQSSLSVLAEKKNTLLQEQNSLEKGNQLLAQNQIDIEQLGTITFDEKEYQKLHQLIVDFEEPYRQYYSIQDDLAKMPSLIEQQQLLEERMTKGQLKIKEKEKEAMQLKFSDENYRKSQTKQVELEQQKDQMQQALQTAELAHKQLTHTLQSQVQQLENDEKIRKTIANNQEEMETLEELDGVFKTFKTYILDRVKPTITQHAGELFQRITKGRYESIHIDDNFEFYIYENGQSYPITRFSGGEIDLANLCLRIGISKAIAELSGQTHTLTFLGFDEIFGSQDEERRFEILAALDLLKEQYRQIYIITHIDAVKEHFPNILQIHKGTMGSQVTWM